MNDNASASMGIENRLHLLRNTASVRTAPSTDGTVNYDSLCYLARFAKCEEDNVFRVSGAYKTLRATPEQSARIANLLCDFATMNFTSEDFPCFVSNRLGIRVKHHTTFPAVAPFLSAEEYARRSEAENLKEIERRQAAQRNRDERRQWELGAAKLLGVDVQASEEELVLVFSSDQALFRPTEDYDLALQLVVVAKLDIQHQDGEIVISHRHHPSMPPSAIFLASSYGGSLPTAICAAAYHWMPK